MPYFFCSKVSTAAKMSDKNCQVLWNNSMLQTRLVKITIKHVLTFFSWYLLVHYKELLIPTSSFYLSVLKNIFGNKNEFIFSLVRLIWKYFEMLQEGTCFELENFAIFALNLSPFCYRYDRFALQHDWKVSQLFSTFWFLEVQLDN